MCDTCGCNSNSQAFSITKPEMSAKDDISEQEKINSRIEKHEKEEKHSHGHGGHSHGSSETISVVSDVLSANNLLAERNRGYFEAKGIKTFNLVSSPGSGKTTLLEKIIELIKGIHSVYVIEGDQQTLFDANRINKAGARAIQINTGNGCHLDARMINQAVKELDIENLSVLFIENVGNLVCPALFDLGEKSRILVLSVTEGDDKPLKYPNMFETSQLCIINKTDLLPYVDFNIEKFKQNARKINHHLDFIETSAIKDENIRAVIEWVLS